MRNMPVILKLKYVVNHRNVALMVSMNEGHTFQFIVLKMSIVYNYINIYGIFNSV